MLQFAKFDWNWNFSIVGNICICITIITQNKSKRMKSEETNSSLLLPDVLLDVNGYPTEEWLQFIRNYQPDDSLPLPKFVSEILPKGLYMSDGGFVLHRRYKGRQKFELHTGGWSGNEEVISTILSNIWLTHFQMQYVMWKAGGHYYFEVTV